MSHIIYAYLLQMNTIQPKQIESDTVENVMAIVLSFMENAIHDAGTYVEHAGRTIVSKKDIRMALQAETFEYMRREDIEGALMYYKEEVHKDIEQHDNPQYEDSDSAEEGAVQTFLQNKVVSDSEMEPYTKSSCKCPVCTHIHRAVAIWDTWVPTTDMEKVIKKVIDTQLID
jgi:histone H3/H4